MSELLQGWVRLLPAEDRKLLADSLAFDKGPEDFLAAMKLLREKHPSVVPPERFAND